MEILIGNLHATLLTSRRNCGTAVAAVRAATASQWQGIVANGCKICKKGLIEYEITKIQLYAHTYTLVCIEFLHVYMYMYTLLNP